MGLNWLFLNQISKANSSFDVLLDFPQFLREFILYLFEGADGVFEIEVQDESFFILFDIFG